VVVATLPLLVLNLARVVRAETRTEPRLNRAGTHTDVQRRPFCTWHRQRGTAEK
jgi:hypothetical protein